ncbi:hypothetical protein JR316_0000327 [Psilocybe cubensis]|uniref:Uncharacterized protein n=2 Tax=Psilocybe cubensis TaxID=181762 RepID=A0ACB8HEC3_PSICU|nr:hypothetical protein JR316_0000327 [Psilocybe cubensis]KAH9486263.1 hypothetical protein JR316_0000327 [Psilocybe cubensis]
MPSSKPLEEFYNVKKLLGAFTDAIEAFEKTHILHGDASPGNILIGENGRGLLMDWDITPEARGVDPNATRLVPADPALPAAVKSALDINAEGPFYRITIKAMSFIIAAPQFMATASPTGRSTRTFKAYDMQTKKYVFMKDSWRILSRSLKPEHETYATLAAAGVHHIPTVLTYDDMDLQETKTCLDVKKDTKRGDRPDKFRSFRHYRLVLNEYAKPLEEFKDMKELLTVFSDTIQAYHEACELGHILHRDVSAGNVMIDDDGHGLLVDWDLSKSTKLPIEQSEGPSLPERTGTWQFIAYRLVAESGPNDTLPKPLHNKDDDLESFWHVLFWTALRRAEHDKETEHIKHILFDVYDRRRILADSKYTPSVTKKYILRQSQYITSEFQFTSSPLATTLENYLAVINKRYIITEASKQLLVSWRDAFLKQNNEAATDEQIGLHLLSKIYSHNMKTKDLNDRIALIDPNEFLLSLQPNWAAKLLEDVFSTTDVSQRNHGGSNQRRLELLTYQKSSMQKRRSESQYSAMSSENDDERDGKPRNKRARKTPALSSINEEGGKFGNPV